MHTSTTAYTRSNERMANAAAANNIMDSCCCSSSSASTSFSFDKTIAMNNLAAKHMEHGANDKAIKALTVAFHTFRKAYHCFQQQQQQQNGTIHLQQQHRQETTSALDAAAIRMNADALFFRSRMNKRRRSSTSSILGSNSDSMATTTTVAAEALESAVQDSMASAATTNTTTTTMCCQHQHHQYAEDADCDDVLLSEEVSFYGNAISLPPDYPISQDSCGFLSTAITFNLALAHHLHGMDLWEHFDPVQKSSSSSSTKPLPANVFKHWQNAGRLYEYTLRLERARSLCKTPPSSGLFVSPFVLLCVLNNLGHLHAQLQNTTQSKKCYVQLQSSVMCWMQFQSKRSNSQRQHHEHHHELIQSFMENSFLGLEQMARVTAVAA